MVFPVKFIIYSIVLTALLTINAVQAVEEVDQRFAPTRRLADPRLMRWDNEIDSIFDDDYEGSEWSTRDRIRPYPGHRGFTRFSRAGSQPHFAFRDNLQETMKRSDVDDKDKPIVPVIRFYEPRLGRVQKRSSN